MLVIVVLFIAFSFPTRRSSDLAAKAASGRRSPRRRAWSIRLRPAGRGTSSFPHSGGTECGNDEVRSEEHTSELQSHSDLVCRLLLEENYIELRWIHLSTQLIVL